MPPDSNIHIEAFRPEFATQWDAYVSDREDATVYHLRAWARVLERVFGFEERSLVCFEGERIVGLLPLWKVNAGTLVNSPWRDRGGILADTSAIAAVLTERLAALPYEIRIKGWSEGQEVRNGFVEHYWINSTLDLSRGEEALWSTVNRSAGRNIRKAGDAGVTVRIAADRDGIRHFYRLFKMTRRRLGVPIYPERLFRSIADNMGDHLRLYTAYAADRPAASIMVFDMHETAIYAFGASDMSLQKLRVNDLLLWTAIRDSLNNGMSRFDFGSDSPLQTDLLRFKKKWGAVQVGMPTLHITRDGKERDTAQDDFTSPRYRFHRSLLRHSPIWLLVLLGTVLTRRDG